MTRYLIRRTFWAVWLFFVATFITYVIFFLIPSSPGRITGFGFAVSPVQAASINSQWHLDVPAYQQYWIFVWNIIRHQSLGYSFQNGASVRWILAQDARVTGSVVLGSAVLWILISLPVGILSALRPRSLFDRFAMGFALVGVSTPVFFLGLVFLYVFWFKLHIASGSGYASIGQGIPTWLNHLIMPWVVLALLFAAFYAWMVRGNLIETMGEDYIRTARAKGISERQVVMKHGLRASLTPVVTMFGMDLGTLLGGAIITETVFNLQGLGQYAVQSVTSGDLYAILDITVIAAFFITISNLVVDIVYAYLDPRVRYA